MRAALGAVLVLLVCQSTPAQLPTPFPEGLSILSVGDYDADGFDDVLAFGKTTSRTYYGFSEKPYLKRGPDWPFETAAELLDIPVFVGGHLYVPSLAARKGIAEIRIYELVNGSWTLRRIEYLRPTVVGGAVTSVRIHPLHKDVDDDKQNDLLAVWNEIPLSKGQGFHSGYVSLNAATSFGKVRALQGQADDYVIVDLHRVKAIVPTKAPEYTVALSANLSPNGGFGFATIGSGLTGPKVEAGVWATGGPRLEFEHDSAVGSAVCHGQFGIAYGLRTPLVQVASGHSILLEPFVLAPYVYNRAEVFEVQEEHLYLGECVADYDSDGRDEVVLVSSSGPQSLAYLTVADPSSNRAYVQHFELTGHPDHLKGRVFHGTAGDFDGDGDQDMIIMYTAYGPFGPKATLAFFECKPRPGKPSLARIY